MICSWFEDSSVNYPSPFNSVVGCLPRDAIILCKRGLCRYAVSVTLCVCLSRSYILSKWKTYRQKFFNRWVATPYQKPTAWQYSDGNLPNGGVKCRWDRQKSRFWANIWLHWVLWTVPAASSNTFSCDEPCRVYNTSRWVVDGRKRRNIQEASTVRRKER